MPYDLEDLRLVAAIAQTGSLTRGAEKMHLAPSSASHRLKLLEAGLGTPLFLRHARGLSAQLEQMHADLAPYASGLSSQVTVFANTNAINCFLPGDLGDFLREHPQLRVSLEEQPSPTILQAVAAGQVDIGVVAAAGPMEGIRTLPYRRDRLVLIVPPGHRLVGGTPIRFRDALNESFVCLHAGSAIHTFMMNIAADLGARLDVRIQVRSFNAACRMVGAGVGIGLVPRSAALESDGPGAPVVVELDEPWAARDLQLCVRDDRSLSPAAGALLAHLAHQGAVREGAAGGGTGSPR